MVVTRIEAFRICADIAYEFHGTDRKSFFEANSKIHPWFWLSGAIVTLFMNDECESDRALRLKECVRYYENN